MNREKNITETIHKIDNKCKLLYVNVKISNVNVKNLQFSNVKVLKVTIVAAVFQWKPYKGISQPYLVLKILQFGCHI